MKCSLKIGEKLGQGTFGAVFKVINNQGTARALKTVAGNIDVSEIDISRRIHHENLIRCHEFLYGECDIDGYGLVLDLAESSLTQALKNASMKTRLTFLRQAIQGAAALHRAGVVHLDIKEDNILIKNGQACLGDFGLSAYIDSPRRGEVLEGSRGTPILEAPEIVEGTALVYSAAVDVWAMGIVLLQVLSGVCVMCKATSIPDLKKKAIAKFSNARPYLRVLLEPVGIYDSGLGSQGTAIYDTIEGMLRINPAERLTLREVLTSSNSEVIWGSVDVTPLQATQISVPRVRPHLARLRDEIISVLLSTELPAAVLFLSLDLAYRCPYRVEAAVVVDLAAALIESAPLPRDIEYFKLIKSLDGYLYPTNPYNIARCAGDLYILLPLILGPTEYTASNETDWASIISESTDYRDTTVLRDTVTVNQLLA